MGLFGNRKKADEPTTIKRQREALVRAQHDSSVPPVTVAKMQVALAETLSQQHTDGAVTEVTSLVENAIQILSPTRFPAEHAAAQRILGTANFLLGGKEGNKTYMGKALPCLKAALVYYTRARSLEAWGRLQMAVGEIYFAQERSRCAQKYLTASLEVITPQRYPKMYEMIQERLEVVEMWILEEEEKKKFFRGLDPSLMDDLEAHFKKEDEEC